jgi:hypothetical protein
MILKMKLRKPSTFSKFTFKKNRQTINILTYNESVVE